MTDAPDLGPAAGRVAALIADVPGDRLAAPTPCAAYTLGDLVDHVGGLALGFLAGARKDPGETAARGPSGDASRLGDDWRTDIPRRLAALADAWRDPAAWTGATRVGGIDLPGRAAGLFALNELVVHGWDLARAMGRPYTPGQADVDACLGLVAGVQARGGPSPFGPPVAVPDDAPPLDRLVALTGRDPAWTPPPA
ncbi:TIGR03086 family protein [Actinomadura rubrobrunea]|uniref:TIGR03086 family protein n=1 Tax=Actinomadura rubrobrunea TaxID=115335 RepID=A0A9W6Q034_9ACTN|nr:TIGR03086 family metal-binding protein [Actinomadura rubrobrunea]GLW67425.1 TIGR03086 family protein [Actinomadura rubrobrunea]